MYFPVFLGSGYAGLGKLFELTIMSSYFVISLDSADASLRARVKPGMTAIRHFIDKISLDYNGFDLHLIYTIMTHLFTYRNPKISTVDVKYIRRLIKAHPEFGRCRLSSEICNFGEWIQPNGHLKDMVCRELLIRLEKEGHITLPSQIIKPANPFLNRRHPDKIVVDETLLSKGLRNLGPITCIYIAR